MLGFACECMSVRQHEQNDPRRRPASERRPSHVMRCLVQLALTVRLKTREIGGAVLLPRIGRSQSPPAASIRAEQRRLESRDAVEHQMILRCSIKQVSALRALSRGRSRWRKATKDSQGALQGASRYQRLCQIMHRAARLPPRAVANPAMQVP